MIKYVCELCNKEVKYKDIRDAYGDGSLAVCLECFKDMNRCEICGYAIRNEETYHINMFLVHLDCVESLISKHSYNN